MKTITKNGYVFNFKNTSEVKYLERVEKDNSISYYRLWNKKEHTQTEYLPTFGRQEFLDIWENLPKT